jgi:hypothetical protein
LAQLVSGYLEIAFVLTRDFPYTTRDPTDKWAMGQFQGSLRLPGDSKSLPATVQLRDGRLQISSGDHAIGDWSIDTIDIAQVPEGIRVKAEGEVLLLDIPDREAFSQAAAFYAPRPKRLARAKRSPKTQKSPSLPSRPVAAEPEPAKPRGESRIDQLLARAKDRFGSKTPDWVFSRWGLAAAVGLLVLCVVFAELVSNLLLIAGVIALLIGGVTMLDSVIARRILHHKVTPIQLVIGGGSIFVVGLLFGFAA